jgi:hypothetical protein
MQPQAQGCKAKTGRFAHIGHRMEQPRAMNSLTVRTPERRLVPPPTGSICSEFGKDPRSASGLGCVKTPRRLRTIEEVVRP